MDCSIICVGDELLDGRIRDRNAFHFGEFLEARGHRLVSVRAVPDREELIGEALEEAASDADLVVVSGGLGPTEDDRTRTAAAAWVDSPLRLDEQLLERLQARFEKHGFTFTKNNRRQCHFPEGARILESEVGTAAGFVVERNGSEAWFFPGVPREFDWFLEHHLEPELVAPSAGAASAARLTFLGLGESGLETRISEAVELAEEREVSVSYLADAPLVTVRLRGADSEDVDEVRQEILGEIGDWLVTENGETLPEKLGRLLGERGESVATAESCTAGWISKEITDVSGSSSWFEYGFVTYADEAKRRMLGVEAETLRAYGAVSPEVVREMAAGARDYADADYAVAVSGIAGPTGGTEEKPVGMVDFGIATPEGVFTRRLQFPPRSRRSVRRRSVQTALGLLVWYLDGRLERHSVEGPFAYTTNTDRG